jgi:signal transduction histidine kinase
MRATTTAIGARRHLVQFYETVEFLARVVTDFIVEGLDADEPIVVIATEPHRRAFRAGLERRGLDPERLLASGRLTLIDAHELLTTLMVDEAPDRGRFMSSIDGLLTAAAGDDGRRVRAFGEMVDLLWQEGNRSGAVALEELWNELAERRSFTLLCAYVVGGLYKVGAPDLHDVCAAHDDVGAPERARAEVEAAVRSASLAREHSRALAAELEHSRAVERALRDALAERQALVTQLQETARLSELFTAILGHDLRNPLNAIVTAAQLGLRQSHDPARTSRCSARILSSGLRMGRMIDQLLDLTRLGLGHDLPLSRAPADLAAIVRQVTDELQVAHPDRPITVEALGDTRGSWDEDRLGQVFSNLIGNAVHHGDASQGVRVVIDGSAPDRVRLDVHNGGTIAPDLIPRLFVPFDAEKRRRSPQGLGLGLYISREVVTAHGGSVDVSSSDALGTTFAVSLPRA